MTTFKTLKGKKVRITVMLDSSAAPCGVGFGNKNQVPDTFCPFIRSSDDCNKAFALGCEGGSWINVDAWPLALGDNLSPKGEDE